MLALRVAEAVAVAAGVAAGVGAAAGAAATTGALPGATGTLARFCMVRSSVRGVEDAAASFWTGSKPNINTVYLQEVEGRPPISNRPASSLTVVILSVPHSAVTVAPGIACPPERTRPVCTSAAAIPAKISKAMHVDFNIKKFPFIWNTGQVYGELLRKTDTPWQPFTNLALRSQLFTIEHAFSCQRSAFSGQLKARV